MSSGKIQDNAVTNSKIADNAVTTAKIDEEAVTDAELATNSVTEEKIATNAVTANKLATDAVTTVKIEDEAVTYDKVLPASKAQMEGQLGTGTHGTPGVVAGVVTPDVLKNSPFSPRAYGVVSYSSSSADPTISNAYNATVTREASDRRRITFTEPLANANYVVIVSLESSDNDLDYKPVMVKAKDAGYFDLESGSAEGSNMSFHFVVFGSTYPNP